MTKHAIDVHAISHVQVNRGDGYRKLKLYVYLFDQNMCILRLIIAAILEHLQFFSGVFMRVCICLGSKSMFEIAAAEGGGKVGVEKLLAKLFCIREPARLSTSERDREKREEGRHAEMEAQSRRPHATKKVS